MNKQSPLAICRVGPLQRKVVVIVLTSRGIVGCQGSCVTKLLPHECLIMQQRRELNR